MARTLQRKATVRAAAETTKRTRRIGRKGDNFTPEQFALLAQLLRDGKSNAEIIQILDVKQRTFHWRLKKADLQIGERVERYLKDRASGDELTPEFILAKAAAARTGVLEGLMQSQAAPPPTETGVLPAPVA